MSDYLSLGLTFFLAGNVLLVLLVGLFSSYSGSVAAQQDTPAVILALTVAGLAGALPSQASGSERFATTLFLILITTTGTGLIFLAMGAFHLGGLVRFLPYPVMGGFLAGTGWLLLTGGIGVMQPIASPAVLFRPDALARKKDDPDALHALSQIVISQTGQRLVTMTRALDALRK